MNRGVVTGLLWFGSIGCGIMAGVYFAFSTFIMAAFSRIEQVHAVEAMNSINSTILHSLFMPVFYGTTLASVLLLAAGFMQRNQPGAAMMISGGLIYFLGMFVCTAVANVPLNNALAAVNPASEAAAPVWSAHLKYWTLWNHLRTISSTAACALYIGAITARTL